MGCFGSRKAYPDEEWTIITAERMLEFHKHNIRTLYEVFLLRARSGLLNSKAVQDAANTLSLPLRSAQQEGLIEQFYHSLRSDTTNVSLHNLMLAAVLLTESSISEKAAVLFELYDQSYSLVISRQAVGEMVRGLMSFAIETPMNVLPPTSDAAVTYLLQLKTVTDEVHKTVLTQLIGDLEDISRERFLTGCSNILVSQFFSATSLRLVLFEARQMKKQHSVPLSQ